jgi:glycosyltransferase involved in cell wall biosynthesis
MKTILVITPYLPYSNVAHAGGQAIYDFIVELKQRGFKVCLASLSWPDESRHFEALRELCDDTFFVVSVPVFTDTFLNSLQSDPIRFLPRIFRGIVKHIRIRARLNEGIRQLIRGHNPDLVQVEYSTMALYLRKLKPAGLRVLHLHDLMMKPYGRLWMGEKNVISRINRFLFFAVLKKIELAFCRTFDLVLVKSQYDRNLLLQHGRFDARVFPLGIRPQAGIEPYTCRETGSVLFVGAMFRKVNEEAALYFIETVLPRLERKIGPVKFYIVGCSPSRSLEKRASEKIIVTGYVDDLSYYYRKCQVSVAPLFVGGGMIFKVLQAMSFGLPVVSSTVANEGIEAADGKEILIADTPEEFADRLASLMCNAEFWQRISGGAHAFVNGRYSWNVVMQDYLRDVDTALQSKST